MYYHDSLAPKFQIVCSQEIQLDVETLFDTPYLSFLLQPYCGLNQNKHSHTHPAIRLTPAPPLALNPIPSKRPLQHKQSHSSSSAKKYTPSFPANQSHTVLSANNDPDLLTSLNGSKAASLIHDDETPSPSEVSPSWVEETWRFTCNAYLQENQLPLGTVYVIAPTEDVLKKAAEMQAENNHHPQGEPNNGPLASVFLLLSFGKQGEAEGNVNSHAVSLLKDNYPPNSCYELHIRIGDVSDRNLTPRWLQNAKRHSPSDTGPSQDSVIDILNLEEVEALMRDMRENYFTNFFNVRARDLEYRTKHQVRRGFRSQMRTYLGGSVRTEEAQALIDLYVDLGRTLMALRNHELALEAFKMALLESGRTPSPQLLLYSADAYLASGEIDQLREGFHLLSQMIQLTPLLGNCELLGQRLYATKAAIQLVHDLSLTLTHHHQHTEAQGFEAMEIAIKFFDFATKRLAEVHFAEDLFVSFPELQLLAATSLHGIALCLNCVAAVLHVRTRHVKHWHEPFKRLLLSNFPNFGASTQQFTSLRDAFPNAPFAYPSSKQRIFFLFRAALKYNEVGFPHLAEICRRTIKHDLLSIGSNLYTSLPPWPKRAWGLGQWPELALWATEGDSCSSIVSSLSRSRCKISTLPKYDKETELSVAIPLLVSGAWVTHRLFPSYMTDKADIKEFEDSITDVPFTIRGPALAFKGVSSTYKRIGENTEQIRLPALEELIGAFGVNSQELAEQEAIIARYETAWTSHELQSQEEISIGGVFYNPFDHEIEIGSLKYELVESQNNVSIYSEPVSNVIMKAHQAIFLRTTVKVPPPGIYHPRAVHVNLPVYNVRCVHRLMESTGSLNKLVNFWDANVTKCPNPTSLLLKVPKKVPPRLEMSRLSTLLQSGLYAHEVVEVRVTHRPLKALVFSANSALAFCDRNGKWKHQIALHEPTNISRVMLRCTPLHEETSFGFRICAVTAEGDFYTVDYFGKIESAHSLTIENYGQDIRCYRFRCKRGPMRCKAELSDNSHQFVLNSGQVYIGTIPKREKEADCSAEFTPLITIECEISSEKRTLMVHANDT